MKKLALAVALAVSANVVFAQADARKPGAAVEAAGPAPSSPAPFLPNAVITQGFDGTTLTTSGCALNPGMVTQGWFAFNTSSPLGASCWNVLQNAPVPNPAPQGGDGYIVSNFNVVAPSSTGNHSAWLVSPPLNFGTGATLEFWARAGGTYADQLEVRLSTAPTAGTPDVGTSSTTFGTFTTLLLTVNSGLTGTANGTCPTANFTATGSTFPTFPTTAWCRFTVSGAALPTSGSGRIAFKSSAPNGGPTGANGNIVRLDTFSFDEGVLGAPAITPARPAGTVTVTGAAGASTAQTTLSFTNGTGAAVVPGTVNCTLSNIVGSVTIAPTAAITLAPGATGGFTVTGSGTPGSTFSATASCAVQGVAAPIVYNIAGSFSSVTQIPTLSIFNLSLLSLMIIGLGALVSRRSN